MKKETLKSKVEYILSTIPETRNETSEMVYEIAKAMMEERKKYVQ